MDLVRGRKEKCLGSSFLLGWLCGEKGEKANMRKKKMTRLPSPFSIILDNM